MLWKQTWGAQASTSTTVSPAALKTQALPLPVGPSRLLSLGLHHQVLQSERCPGCREALQTSSS